MFNCKDWKSVLRRKDTQITDFKGRGKRLQLEARALSECFAFLRYQILTHSHDRPYLTPPCLCPTSLWLATPGDSQFPQYLPYHGFPHATSPSGRTFPSLSQEPLSHSAYHSIKSAIWRLSDTWADRAICVVLSVSLKHSTSWTFIVSSSKYELLSYDTFQRHSKRQ